MARKHIITLSTSFLIRDIQTTMRSQWTPIRMLRIKKTGNKTKY